MTYPNSASRSYYTNLGLAFRKYKKLLLVPGLFIPVYLVTVYLGILNEFLLLKLILIVWFGCSFIAIRFFVFYWLQHYPNEKSTTLSPTAIQITYPYPKDTKQIELKLIKEISVNRFGGKNIATIHYSKGKETALVQIEAVPVQAWRELARQSTIPTRLYFHSEYIENLDTYCICKDFTKEELVIPLTDWYAFLPTYPALTYQGKEENYNGIEPDNRFGVLHYSLATPQGSFPVDVSQGAVYISLPKYTDPVTVREIAAALNAQYKIYDLMPFPNIQAAR